MTKNQIEKLKLLGYEDTQECGAILRHPNILCEPDLLKVDCFVWQDDKFDDVLAAFSRNLMVSTLISQADGLRGMARVFARDTFKSSK